MSRSVVFVHTRPSRYCPTGKLHASWCMYANGERLRQDELRGDEECCKLCLPGGVPTR